MENNTVQKPLTVLRDEFLEKLLYLCNNAGLPYFVIEGLLKDMITDVHAASIQQQKMERESYERAVIQSVSDDAKSDADNVTNTKNK